MEIRFAKKEDKPALMNLWGYCFTDGDAYIRWNFDHRYREEDTLVSVEQGEICGMIQLLPGRFWVDGRETEASFIEGLAVAPHWRSCGVAGRLMQAAYEQMRLRGHSMSFLIPFSPAFYQKQGYGVCTWTKEVKLEMGSIRHYPVGGKWRIARMDDEKTACAMDFAYRAYCADKNCYQIRSRREWEFILQDAALSGGNVFLLERNLECAGYVIYILQDGEFHVNEMCYTDFEAFGAVMDFIRRHGPQAECALLRLAEGDPVAREFAGSAVREFSYAMARVIDAQAVLEACSRHFYGEAVIRIRDEQCPWNTGVYRVQENEALLLEGEEAGELVSMDMETLSELASGAISVEEAAYLGKIEGDGTALDGLFRKQSNFMNLMFE